MAERHVDYLLIGGGLAAGNCARWLREEGADGSILLVGREPDLPYNRPPCSKGYLQGKESREEVTLSRTFGEQAGRFFQSRLEEHGIEAHGGDSLERFEGTDGRITKVVTKRGLELEADSVVIGAGVAPEVTLARNAGLELRES